MRIPLRPRDILSPWVSRSRSSALSARMLNGNQHLFSRHPAQAINWLFLKPSPSIGIPMQNYLGQARKVTAKAWA
ncbi:hypothetical protein I7I50_06990 [Histoplasma capsulatum G186AR]|uniref:Uncharacterized protein n=1 Tax=Ajellomyces capsulatus TaxID=5037 RepID=A0A8H8D2U0_AJECA|nr:hypothetical protein I7I52_09936 [Histoplasma capsulatum]QSS67804.1 hypothetical protein I7I50_06990 [Histoplasma capsulatum G186AR]